MKKALAPKPSMSSPGAIDAIIVNYRCASETLSAVDRLAGWPGTIWVVDNSAETVEANLLRAALSGHHGIRLLLAEDNLGFAGGCNLAYAQGKAPYVLLLNPDARIDPAEVERLVAVMEIMPRLAAVAPAIFWDEGRRFLLPTLMPEEPLWWLGRTIASRWPQGTGKAMAQAWLKWQGRLHAAVSPQSVRYLSGAVLLLRRSAIEQAGGLFDQRYFMFYEDADLSRRLCQAGFGLALLPTAHAVHRWRNRQNKYPLMAQSAPLYNRRHFPRLCRFASLWHGRAEAPFAPLAGLPDRQADRWGLGRLLPGPIGSLSNLEQVLSSRAIQAISPSPTGFPAIFRPRGKSFAALAEEDWGALDAGRYLCLARDGDACEWLAFDKAS
jgi:GT2 family glycosyltransferase